MARYALRLLEDRLAAGLRVPVTLPAIRRVLYVVEGDLLITQGEATAQVRTNAAWHGTDACTISPGAGGTRLWRWELVSLPVPHDGRLLGEAVESTEKLVSEVTLDPQTPYLMRCDRVDFPPGGIAYTHTHQGPGIRCLLFGEFTVQVHGKPTHVHAGGAWFESGPDAVYAAASEDGPAAFARVMILPRALKGKSSIRYVKPEDQDKRKPQQYTMFVDELIDL